MTSTTTGNTIAVPNAKQYGGVQVTMQGDKGILSRMSSKCIRELI
jgi:hypothetical protein